MFKCDLVACKQHLIPLIGLLTISSLVFKMYTPQQQIALDTYAIFQQSCLICHGPDGAYKETLLIEHNALIQNGSSRSGKSLMLLSCTIEAHNH